MTNDRSAADVGTVGNAWTRFWFMPIPTTGLKTLRVLSGLLFFAWLGSFMGHQAELFSLNGFFDTRAYKEVQLEQGLAPAPIGWSILYIAGESVAAFQAMYFGSLLVLLLFALGVTTRITGILTWVIVVSFLANPATFYEGDYLLAILAFYLMIGHLLVGQWNGKLTMPERFLGARNDFAFAPWLWARNDVERPVSTGANFMMRMFQIHFAIIILTSVLHKLQIADWWSGVALWYPLHPTFKTTAESLLAERKNANVTLFFLSLAQYLVLAWQLGFPTFAWRAGWCRAVLLGGAVIGWLGAYFLFQLPLFGPFVVLGSLSFLRPEEWAWASERLRFKVGAAEKVDTIVETKKAPIAVAKESIKK